MKYDMNNAETAAEIRRWASAPRSVFSWPTDACGYRQHMRYVTHRNKHWRGGDHKAFLLAYAAAIEKEPDAPATQSPGTTGGER